MKNRKKIRRTAAIAAMMSLGILAVSAAGKGAEKILETKSEAETGNDIENMTKKDYPDVSYVCSLNEEARDYIADIFSRNRIV